METKLIGMTVCDSFTPIYNIISLIYSMIHTMFDECTAVITDSNRVEYVHFVNQMDLSTNACDPLNDKGVDDFWLEKIIYFTSITSKPTLDTSSSTSRLLLKHLTNFDLIQSVA